MRILGYVHLEPVHYDRTQIPHLNGTRLSSAAARLNDYHAQIEFILRESGFLRLQELGFNWNLRIGEVVLPVTFHMYMFRLLSATQKVMIVCVVITQPGSKQSNRFVMIANVRRTCAPIHKVLSTRNGIQRNWIA